jgi:hypothetical protein
MAIKVGATTVIDNDRAMGNIADTAGNGCFIYDSAPDLTSITDNINFTTPLQNAVMSGDTTYTESGAAEGKSVQILLDTTTSAHTPTFSSNINWQGGTEPTWSGYQRWHIIMTALSSSDIRAVAFGYTVQSGGTPSSMPAGSATAREGGTNLTAIADDRENGDPGTGATATSGHRIRFYGRSGGGSRIFWTPVGNGDTGTGDKNAWYNTSGTASAHISAGTTVDFWSENTLDLDSTRLVITTTTGTVISDSGYVATTSTSTGADLTFSDSTTTLSAGTWNGSRTRLMECWARKSGYADTKVATWRFQADTTAIEASCFLGDVMLYMMEDGVITQVAMEDAWQAWEARRKGTEHHCVDQNGDSCQILNFTRIENLTDNVYSINGSDAFVTGGHPFLTTDGWKCADLERGTGTYPDLALTQLAVGDVLLKHNGEQETITDITGSESTETVYVIDVDGDDTYIANGYIVHNK